MQPEVSVTAAVRAVTAGEVLRCRAEEIMVRSKRLCWLCLLVGFVIGVPTGVASDGGTIELQVRSNIVDGFESGDTTAWSLAVP